VLRRALGGVLGAYGNGVVIDMSIVKMMQMSIVKVISMSIVPDGLMAATLAMDVAVIFMF
jgi:hypothetical protein